jgi:hypothetical protein
VRHQHQPEANQWLQNRNLLAEGRKLLAPNWKKRLQRRKQLNPKRLLPKRAKSDGRIKVMVEVAPEEREEAEVGVGSWATTRVVTKKASQVDPLGQVKSVQMATVDGLPSAPAAVASVAAGSVVVEAAPLRVLEARGAVEPGVVREAPAPSMKVDPAVYMF